MSPRILAWCGCLVLGACTMQGGALSLEEQPRPRQSSGADAAAPAAPATDPVPTRAAADDHATTVAAEDSDPSRAPLTEAELAILYGSAEDPVPEHRGGVTTSQENKHYLSSNEKALQAFFPTLDGIGGGYLGVGTDQGYLFIGWARSEIAWLVDYDPAVQQIHELYRLFFLAADTPQQLVGLWSQSEQERAIALIDEAHDEDRARRLRYWYRSARGRIDARLRKLVRGLAKAGVPSVFDDQDTYDHVRRMVEQRRIRVMRVNLLEEQGLAGIGEAARALGVPLRVLYLSNAEQYWKRYPKAFRERMAALPWADDAVLLRTITAKAANDDYRYNVQPTANFVQWLAQPFVGNVHHIVHAGPPASATGVTVFRTEDDPQSSPVGRRWQRRQAEAG
ncbi:MAG: hypothetical protein AB1Z98_10535 [Nannocystaceae bacterium]